MSKKNKNKRRSKSTSESKVKAPLHPELRAKIKSLMTSAELFLQKGNLPQAISHYQQILQLDPSNLDALEQMGLAAYKSAQGELAMRCWSQVTRLAPKRLRSHYMLGVLFAGAGQVEDAIKAYKQACQLEPRFIEAFNNLGVLYKNEERFEEAIDCFSHVVKLQPKSAFALSNLGNVLKEAGFMKEAVETLERAVKADPKLASAYSNLLVALNYLSEQDPVGVRKRHEEWASHVPDSIRASRFDFSNWPSVKGRKLRVGFVSPDLHQHSVAYFAAPLFEHLNRNKFELFAYYNHERVDDTSRRLKGLCDQWTPIANMDEHEAADKIFSDQLDVLIDLAGHTANNRLAVFLQKPAPIQMTWLGYPNTTGLSQIDYRIGDKITDPLDALKTSGASTTPEVSTTTGHSTTEALIHLDGPFICYEAPDDAPEIAPSPCLTNGYLTFGSFNNLVKVTPDVIDFWVSLLKAIPDSRLLLKSRQLGNAMTKARIIGEFEKQGIDSERLILREMISGRKAHLELYNSIDIGLDTFPYNGTTTTCEALHMSLPVMAVMGTNHASRVSASILKHAGLDSLVFENLQAALNWAREMNSDHEKLNALRMSIRPSFSKSKVCDSASFALSFEKLLITCVEK